MGQLSERIAHLTTRYGSDAAAWQHEIHALAALEGADPRAALERFYELKRRLAQFRRAQLIDELRAYPFVRDLPSLDATGYEPHELEADIRTGTRALRSARDIETALWETREAVRTLRLRAAPDIPADLTAAWDALAPLAAIAEETRRKAARAARQERRLADVTRRAERLRALRPMPPDAKLDDDALDAALDATEAALRDAEMIEEAHRAAVAPLRAPEVATYRHASRRMLEQEAERALRARDTPTLDDIHRRAVALREEAAKLAGQAARARRRGATGPAGEKRPGDTIDGYG